MICATVISHLFHSKYIFWFFNNANSFTATFCTYWANISITPISTYFAKLYVAFCIKQIMSKLFNISSVHIDYGISISFGRLLSNRRKLCKTIYKPVHPFYITFHYIPIPAGIFGILSFFTLLTCSTQLFTALFTKSVNISASSGSITSGLILISKSSYLPFIDAV